MKKLSLMEIIKQNDFDDPEQIPQNILKFVQFVQQETKEGGWSGMPSEGAVIAAGLVALDFIEPDQAWGNPHTYQEILRMLGGNE